MTLIRHVIGDQEVESLSGERFPDTNPLTPPQEGPPMPAWALRQWATRSGGGSPTPQRPEKASRSEW